MEPEAALKQWVFEHRVTWEMTPWQELVDRVPRAVGYELRLYGRHHDGVSASPGCRQCVAVYERLRAIALSVLPTEHRPTRYDIEAFDSALHMRPEGDWEPEVELTIQLSHRDGYLSPLDECEKKCAEEIRKGLERLGVQPKSWSGTRVAAHVS